MQPKRNKPWHHLLKLHTAVFLFGLAGLFAKFVHHSPLVIVFGRVLFASITLFALLRFRREHFALQRKRDRLGLSLSGLILAAHWLTFFHAIQLAGVALGLLSFSTFPVFVAFLEPMANREKLQLRSLIVALVTLLGAVVIVPSFQFKDTATQGVLWGIVSGFAFAVLALLNKKYVVSYSSQVIAFYQDAVATIALLPLVLLVRPVLTTPDILWLVLLGVLLTATAHARFINSLIRIPAQRASVITCLEPVYGILFATLLFQDIPSLRTIMGGAIILGTTIYTTLLGANPRNNNPRHV